MARFFWIEADLAGVEQDAALALVGVEAALVGVPTALARRSLRAF